LRLFSRNEERHEPQYQGSGSRIEKRKGRASVEELLLIADRAATNVKRPYADHADLLYDENGIPK
jgi:antitoxin VapB